MSLPTLFSIRQQGFGAWDDPGKVLDLWIQLCLDAVEPLYAGITEGLDHTKLLMYHAAHYLDLALTWKKKQVANNGQGQVGDVTSASAGEVSVSFGVIGVNPLDPGSFGLTRCGIILAALRKAQGSFVAGGNGAVPWRPRM